MEDVGPRFMEHGPIVTHATAPAGTDTRDAAMLEQRPLRPVTLAAQASRDAGSCGLLLRGARRSHLEHRQALGLAGTCRPVNRLADRKPDQSGANRRQHRDASL